MTITANLVKELREKTGAGRMDCKKALSDAEGDLEKAAILLREWGIAGALKKATRETKEGLVSSYIHGGRIGVLIEVNCETDFVARNREFQELVKDLAMQVASSSPLYVRREDVPEEALRLEKEIYRTQARQTGKPEAVVDKIAEGKLEKYFKDNCLMEQAFIKDPSVTVDEWIKQKISKTGENIIVRRFARFQLGEKV
jgi:elongation factor Ts